MPAFRLLDNEGQVIGAIVLDRKELEDEIVNGLPTLRLDYSTLLTNVLTFTLVVVPPDVDCKTLPNGECVADNCSLHG